MLKTSANGAQASSAKFSLRPTAETLADLSRPIDPRNLKTRKQGTATLTYCPWITIARRLHHRAPGWCWEVQSIQEVGGYGASDHTHLSRVNQVDGLRQSG